MDKNQVYKFIEDKKTIFTEVNDSIWDYSETAFEEFKSAEILCKTLEKFEFKIEEGVADIETAFVATWGSGSPVIGFLGEYDALSGMSQVPCIDEKKALVENGNGHGCGHNTLGAGSLAAAIAFKEYLEKNGMQGTVKYFGCPGEEGGAGKSFMAQAGVFNGLDIALTWHPQSINKVMDNTLLANYQVLYKFKGKTAHAAAAPHNGRSALDALELMNVGVQFLREHVIQEARIHYAITNTGGFSPNVVQDNAEVLYLIRAPKMDQVEEIYQRINKIAEGMAMATETEVEVDFIKLTANVVPNQSLNGLLYKNLLEAPEIMYTPEEIALADAINGKIDTPPSLKVAGITDEDAPIYLEKMKDKSLFTEVVPFYPERDPILIPASTDVGDVSWNVPTAQIGVTTWTTKTSPHTWGAVSAGRSGIAHKGLVYAAQVLAGTAIDLIENQSSIQSAKDEFDNRMQGLKYETFARPELKPRAISSL